MMNNAALAWSLGQITADEKYRKFQELTDFYDSLAVEDIELKNKSKSVSINKRNNKTKGENKK